MMDADGAGRKVIDLPQKMIDAFPYKQSDLDMQLVSPDGHWLAFYTGSAGIYEEMPPQGTYELTLNLLDLKTGEQQVIASLLSKDYPNNFVEAAKKLNDQNINAISLHDAFINGITQAIAWSPNGRYLAFAGQMDGLSSDLYLYDLETKTIRRMSSGDQELQWINWSPDGKWILHESLFWVGEGMKYDIYAAALDGSSIHQFPAGLAGDWLNLHEYFEYDGANGPGSFGLRLVDIDTGKIKKIWDGSFDSYAIDKSNMWIAVLANSSDISPYTGSGGISYDPDFIPAIYLINLMTLEKMRVE